MSITLDAITLPADLIWLDEFDWSPMTQSETYTLSGALVIESAQMLAGRPITLVGGDNAAWVDRTTLAALYAKLTDDPTMTLTLHDARTFSVKFKMAGQPIQARPIIDYNTPASGDYYSLTIKLFTV
jgi:hypothetical protein